MKGERLEVNEDEDNFVVRRAAGLYERLRGKGEQNKFAPVKCYLEAVGKPFSNSLCIFSVIAITLPREYWQLRLYATEHVHTPTSILYILYFNGI